MIKKSKVSLPYITSYPEIATVLSLIDRETSFPWLANWFLQIEAYRHQEDGLLLDYCIPDPFTSCPWILYEKISRTFIQDRWASVTDFMIDAVNNGQVASFVVDTSRISLYKNSFGYSGHTIMLYGYDTDKKLFYVGDNFAVSNKSFSFSTCPFEELESAYTGVTGTEGRIDWVHGVRLISPKTIFDHGHNQFYHKYNWIFSKELFITLAEDFLYSRNSTKWFSSPRLTYSEAEYYYGMDCISYVTDILQTLRGDPIDIRGVFLLKEYAELMDMRVSYLLGSHILHDNHLREIAGEVREKSRLFLILSLKYNLTLKKSIMDSILFRLEEFRKTVKRLVENIIIDISLT